MKRIILALSICLLPMAALATTKPDPKPTTGSQEQSQGQGQDQSQDQTQGQAQGQAQGQGQSVHIEGGIGGIACDFGIALPGGSLCLPRSNRHAKIVAEAEALSQTYGPEMGLRHICMNIPRVKKTLGTCPLAPLSNPDKYK